MTDAARQIKLRIVVTAAACAYEVNDDPFLTDAEYDTLAKLIRPEVRTGRAELDHFFATKFSPHTGQWIHEHPERHKLPRIIRLLRAGYPASVRGLLKPKVPVIDLLA